MYEVSFHKTVYYVVMEMREDLEYAIFILLHAISNIICNTRKYFKTKRFLEHNSNFYDMKSQDESDRFSVNVTAL